jgi:capsular polysaccharide biosynthesis protein
MTAELFADRIERVDGGVVVPKRAHDGRRAEGVLRADGSFVEASRSWIRANVASDPPALAADEPVAALAGRHLFGGHLRGHFGHFIVESTARLWALDELGGRIDGIVFLPYREGGERMDRLLQAKLPFFALMGVTVPIHLPQTAVRVESLDVADLGFGWKERYAGSPRYRGFMRERLGAGVAAEGAADLYVSRAGLMAKRGGVLGEQVIEANLARAGYEIFRPEKHPLEVQIARYKAARRIVALDGSALHLAAFFVAPGARVAIVLRRSKANFADYRLQYRSFAGIEPDRIEVIRRDWVSGARGRVDYASVGELDFAALFARLAAAGYLPAGFRPDLPDAAAVAAMAAAFAERRGEALIPLQAGA